MKKILSKIAKEVEIIILGENEPLPKGYMPIAGRLMNGKEMQAAIPEKFAFANIKLANKVIREVDDELKRLLSI